MCHTHVCKFVGVSPGVQVGMPICGCVVNRQECVITWEWVQLYLLCMPSSHRRGTFSVCPGVCIDVSSGLCACTSVINVCAVYLYHGWFSGIA